MGAIKHTDGVDTQSKLPRITIITPTYNQGYFIEETILSVLSQNYPNLEYIIIDGGSTDETVAIVKKYEEHLSYWVSEKDSGQSNAINKGLQVATGSIINWLNSDDILLPDCLKTVAAYFINNPEVSLVHGNFKYFSNKDELATPFFKANKLQYYSHICFAQPATFFSKKIIEMLGPIDESIHFSMDWDLYVRASLAGFIFLPAKEVFCKFRIHSSSKTISSFNKQFLIDNAFIFYSVVKSVNPKFDFIDKLYNELNIEIPIYHKKYRVSVLLSDEDLNSMIFFFLEYRCKTLFFNKDYKGIKNLVIVSKKYYKEATNASRSIRYRYLISQLPGFIIELFPKALLISRSPLIKLLNLFRFKRKKNVSRLAVV